MNLHCESFYSEACFYATLNRAEMKKWASRAAKATDQQDYSWSRFYETNAYIRMCNALGWLSVPYDKAVYRRV